jgi:LysM repeat protein
MILLLIGCGAPENSEAALPPVPDPAVITPHLTSTPFHTTAPTATEAPTPTPPPLPTPTPYLYTVVEADTLIGIASYFGITLDELTLANPDVNPNFLSVGTQLVIPLSAGEDQPEASAGAEPEILPLQTGELICTANQLDGLWCVWPVTNSLDQPVENITALIRLYGEDSDEVLSETAYSLLNVIYPGEQIPLAIYFQPPLPDWESSQAQLSNATTANQVEERYFSTTVTSLQTEPLDENRIGYLVSGTVTLTQPAADPKEEAALPAYVWVVAVAYDENGQVIGLRRWEAPAEALGEEVNFSFEVFSLGEPIERVEVLAEARIEKSIKNRAVSARSIFSSRFLIP